MICPVDNNRGSETKLTFGPKHPNFGVKLAHFVLSAPFKPRRSMFSTQKRCLNWFTVMRVPKVLLQDGFNHSGGILLYTWNKKIIGLGSDKDIDNSNRLFFKKNQIRNIRVYKKTRGGSGCMNHVSDKQQYLLQMCRHLLWHSWSFAKFHKKKQNHVPSVFHRLIISLDKNIGRLCTRVRTTTG